MKKFALLSILIFTALTYCKKENDVQLRFLPNLEDKTDILGWNWDSIAFTKIYYSMGSEIKTTEDKDNPGIYHHSIEIDVRNNYLTFKAGTACVIKKFDMVGKSGKVLFYIPYEGQPGSDKLGLKLPIILPMNNSKSINIGVVRFSN